ncbi:Uncharacterised protein [Mycobacteroides abscessus subsp. abscessus]|nr:Uncharacterised protein [Mycobacteroides abscessus subsp. abscessus]
METVVPARSSCSGRAAKFTGTNRPPPSRRTASSAPTLGELGPTGCPLGPRTGRVPQAASTPAAAVAAPSCKNPRRPHCDRDTAMNRSFHVLSCRLSQLRKTHVKYRVRVCAHHVMVNLCCRPQASCNLAGNPRSGGGR